MEKLNNVIFIPRQPQARMPYFFAFADALLVHLKREPLFEITIPSKTIAYLACAKPIIGCVSGDAAEVIRSAKAGLICQPQDPEALADTVRKLFSMPQALRREMGEAGRREFLKEYKKSILIKRYEEIFKEITL